MSSGIIKPPKYVNADGYMYKRLNKNKCNTEEE